MRPRFVPAGPPLAALLLLVALATGCASPISPLPSAAGQSPSAPAPSAASAPVGVAVIGHSGATGYDSDPTQPGQDATANSWATGTNPDVQSIFSRLLADDAGLEAHAMNLAIDGSGVTSLRQQAAEVVRRSPLPQIVLVQTIDNDMRCDGTDAANYEPYWLHLLDVLDVVTQGAPEAQIFFVSQWADVETYDRVVFNVNPDHLTGDGPCDTVNPATGQIDAAKEAYLQSLLNDYWGIVTKVCGNYPTCRTDGGAAQGMDLAPGDMTPDLDHLSVAGHTKMAAIEFEALFGPGLSLVGLGDSIAAAGDGNGPTGECTCWSYVERYGQLATSALGVKVVTTNLGSGGETAHELLNRVRTEDRYRSAIAAADLITITVGGNDWGGACSWPGNEACWAAGAASVPADIDAVLGEIEVLRAGKPTVIRVTDYYNNYIGDPINETSVGDPNGPMPQDFLDWYRGPLEAFNASICEVVAKHNAVCIDIAVPFNGAAHDQAATDLLVADHVHPNQAGHDLIANTIAAAGFAPLQ
ncbi:MAG: SGNH/GDSL hydrolase family protein [Chloroflexota bacterium]